MDLLEDEGTLPNKELAMDLLQNYVVTDEDMSRELSNADLEKLCRRNKCKVEMWKWNVVEDFVQIYRSSGRLEGKSRKFINKLLVKSVRKNAHLIKNAEERKEKEMMEDWRVRKKTSILQLDLWKYDEEHLSELDETDDELFTIMANDSAESSNSSQSLSEVNKSLSNSEELANAEAGLPLKEELANDLEVLGTESMTIPTMSLSFYSQNVQESQGAEQHVMNLSQILEPPVTPVYIQTQDYEDFNENIPIASTQDVHVDIGN